MNKVSDEQICRKLAEASIMNNDLRAFVKRAEEGRVPLAVGTVEHVIDTVRDLMHIVRTKRDEDIIENHYGFKLQETHES
jgi:hypothetical protein